ncbi:MAG TPA: ATP-binding protein [Roseiflexaceae bacterium]|nr:ATP-binding protein [Roseiflexaceae bacterium]
MPRTPRIGIQIEHTEPYWVQVREAIRQQGRSRSAETVEILIPEHQLLSVDEQIEVVEDLAVQDLDAVICNTLPLDLITRLLDHGFPVIYIPEHSLRHPRFASRTGLYEAAYLLGTFVDTRLPDRAQILVVGGPAVDDVGGPDPGDMSGQSRVDGFMAALPPARRAMLHRVPCTWTYEAAFGRVGAYLAAHPNLTVDAVFGLSDTLALAANAACRGREQLREGALVVGVNGDPLALAAISAGQMTATIEIDLDDLAAQAFDLALSAARGEPLRPLFTCRQRLVTGENVAEAATRKLLSLASLPTHLIEDNQRHEQQRTLQAETSAAIDRKVGLLLDEQQLAQALTSLIRDSYGFDQARFLHLDPASGQLLAARDEQASAEQPEGELDGPLAYALAKDQLVFIPDTAASHRFPPDPRWPEAQARVVVPVRLGGQVIGLLDLHRRTVTHHTRDELAGLQLLADRFGITVRNAQLYRKEQEARALAEQADRIKTTLLANVSHELRTPLNVILGYSRGGLDSLARGDASPSELADDFRQIYRSGDHLLRLINDLLDISRAEIGELDLMPERIAPRPLLEEIFRASVEGFGTAEGVEWRMMVAPTLPLIDVDPVRLRQILLNLLHNAHKFTERGSITFGAEVAGRELHLWVADTGPGISAELRTQIFEPFVSGPAAGRSREGIGLGLSITRRLVSLHRGRLTVESEVGRGSTFHIYLPLPDLVTSTSAASEPSGRVLLLISEGASLPVAVAHLAERRGLSLHLLRSSEDLAGVLQSIRPALLAWDVTTAADDGLRIIEEIRNRPDFRQLPVMIYGGAATAESLGAATGVLLKPLGEEMLLEALSDLDPRTPDGSILIVEDDPQARAQHRRLIAQRFPGYRIRDAGDGRAGLAAVAAEVPSLIILDLLLPELDGFAVLEALRAEPQTAGIPVLVLSGKSLTGDDIRRLSEARVIFQTKDLLTNEELAESLRRTISPAERLPRYTSALVKQAIAFIQQQYAEPLSRQAIANAVGVNKDYLGRIFHQEVGLSPWEYLIRYRLLRARQLLRETDLTVAEVAVRVGFETPTYFSRIFHREVGCSPRAYRAQQPM